MRYRLFMTEFTSTLHAEDTTAAIVVGWRIDPRRHSCSVDRVEALAHALQGALATRGESLSLFVPGDTQHEGAVPGSFVLGRAVVSVEANDVDPAPVEPAALRAALAALPKLDAAFWREVLAVVHEFEPSSTPDIHLLSWGPLCYGTLCAGIAATRECEDEDADADEHEFVYEFIANQDMAQEWSHSGIDGVHLHNVEFGDIEVIPLEPAQLAAAERLADASFWLLCRYD
jgi:hypothetical protein